MKGWAIDLGTTNTVVSYWDQAHGRPSILKLPEICRNPFGTEHLEAPEAIPSATHVLPAHDLKTRIGAWRPMMKRFFLGTQAHIGRRALELNQAQVHPQFAPTFKALLGRESLRPIVRAGDQRFTVRDVARMFVRELLAEIKRAHDQRIRDVVLTTPIDAYESYRAELSGIFGDLGVGRVRFIDEPVAAAIGYGLSVDRSRTVLVIDFGGGTLHFVLARMTAKGAELGSCQVLAKEARPVGGRLVDRWLLDEFCRRLDCPIRVDPETEDEAFWQRLMLAEACRVKEAVFFAPEDTFQLIAREELEGLRLRGQEIKTRLDVKREDLVEILKAQGLYDTFQGCIAEIESKGGAPIDDVLMVGGSTLLPGVYPLVEERFGRDRVRAWQPFDAVAYGASVFAQGAFTQSDFIVHDYAFVTYDPKTHDKQYTVIVPRGTRFPTASTFWKRQLVPTCTLGEPERLFKLVICELGSSETDHRYAWDGSGNLHRLSKTNANEPLVVALNESSPTLGTLDPPHAPEDRRPRLEISFGVNADRWLHATVRDLKTRRTLMAEQPVVRLL
jgi:molecular chaperone DnaK (HSP70)